MFFNVVVNPLFTNVLQCCCCCLYSTNLYCTYLQVNVYKEPITDSGKKSKKGRLSLELDESGHYYTRTEIMEESKTVILQLSIAM